jgi:hypothetical protein
MSVTEQEQTTPPSIGDILADLQGFGVEHFDEPLEMTCGGKLMRFKLSNLPIEDDINAILAVEGTKDYAFYQNVKVELLARSFSWLNGVDLRKLTPDQKIVVDPRDGQRKELHVVFRNMLLSFGQEVIHVLWKVFMLHANNIETRLFDSFPDAAVLTEVEMRYRDRIEREINQAVSTVIQEGVEALKKEGESDN